MSGTHRRIEVAFVGLLAAVMVFGLQVTAAHAALANDNFANATKISGSLLREGAPGTTKNATKEAGEPEHAGNAGGASVWFRWTAPGSGPVELDTCGTSTDTLLAVYTGTEVSSLTPVASNDNGAGECAPSSELSFEAVENTAYKIASTGQAAMKGGSTCT